MAGSGEAIDKASGDDSAEATQIPLESDHRDAQSNKDQADDGAAPRSSPQQQNDEATTGAQTSYIGSPSAQSIKVKEEDISQQFASMDLR